MTQHTPGPEIAADARGDYWKGRCAKAESINRDLLAALEAGLRASNRYDYPLNRPGDTFDELMAEFDVAARAAIAKAKGE